MKKKVENKKVFTASDFAGCSVSMLIDNSFWVIDDIDTTECGEFSNTPLFEIQFKRVDVNSDADVPEGYEDASFDLEPNRTYYVREGRPLYNALAAVFSDSGCDRDILRCWVIDTYKNKVFRGHVERLSGVQYHYVTNRGTDVLRSKMEVWYPASYDEGHIMDDFLYLCNKGVYTPVISETPTDPMDEIISKLDPKLIEAILAKKK